MKIYVNSGERTVIIPFPTALIFNDLTAMIGMMVMKKQVPEKSVPITQKQLTTLFKEFRRIKRKYGSWVLVDVQSAYGQKVKITL